MNEFYDRGSVSKNEDNSNNVDAQLVILIRNIISEYSFEVFKDEQKAIEVFCDALEDRTKEKNLIKIIISSGYIDDMVRRRGTSSYWMCSPEVLAKKLKNEYCIEYEPAYKILKCFETAIMDISRAEKGKTTCNELKRLREEFAKANDIPYTDKECTNTDPCNGTCPYCESKSKYLLEEAKKISESGIVIYPSIDISEDLNSNCQPDSQNEASNSTNEVITQGIIDYSYDGEVDDEIDNTLDEILSDI